MEPEQAKLKETEQSSVCQELGCCGGRDAGRRVQPPSRKYEWAPGTAVQHRDYGLVRSTVFLGFPGGSAGKESAYDAEDLGSAPGLGRSPGEGNGNPLQYACPENSMDRWLGHKELDTIEWLTRTLYIWKLLRG